MSSTSLSVWGDIDERKSQLKPISDMAGMIHKNKNLNEYLKEELFTEFLILGVPAEESKHESLQMSNERLMPDLLKCYPNKEAVA